VIELRSAERATVEALVALRAVALKAIKPSSLSPYAPTAELTVLVMRALALAMIQAPTCLPVASGRLSGMTEQDVENLGALLARTPRSADGVRAQKWQIEVECRLDWLGDIVGDQGVKALKTAWEDRGEVAPT